MLPPPGFSLLLPVLFPVGGCFFSERVLTTLQAIADCFQPAQLLIVMDTYISNPRWSSNTRIQYRRFIERFEQAFPDSSHISAVELTSWLETQNWSLASQHVGLSAIRGWLRYKHGGSVPALSASLPPAHPSPQRTLTAEQVRALLSSFNSMSPIGRRDLAMCELMLDSGVRVSEVANLQMKHLNLKDGEFTTVIKGGRWGRGVFGPATARSLSVWLAEREPIAAAQTVFVSIRTGQRLTRHGIKAAVRGWGIRSGIGKLSPHDFRRTFATLATRNGAPARVLMEAGRWQSSAMIARYTQAINQDDFRQYSPVEHILADW